MSEPILTTPRVILFDWGDTLMVDDPSQQGKMCLWPKVSATAGAQDVLKKLSQHFPIYVATNAQDSSVADIEAAFSRVDLSQYISGYFCFDNLSVGKDHPDFYPRIASKLNVDVQDLLMVGDTPDKDIYPALDAGLQAIWFNPANMTELGSMTAIQALDELIALFEIKS
ncbi:HAD family hydrolase [Vibrio astriarenae]|uniref:HAD family hydrolase n=1 Tax=Vibrio astriarenae TaxID=1481923 RepID=UPI0037370F62